MLAALAFAFYSLIGQTFVHASALPPSTVVNEDLFLRTFGFPVQLLRAGAAVVSAWAVVRFLHSFEVETQHKIAELQATQLHEAQRREARLSVWACAAFQTCSGWMSTKRPGNCGRLKGWSHVPWMICNGSLPTCVPHIWMIWDCRRRCGGMPVKYKAALL